MYATSNSTPFYGVYSLYLLLCVVAVAVTVAAAAVSAETVMFVVYSRNIYFSLASILFGA